jgi:hypothetical protein
MTALNHRQERFCQLIKRGIPPYRAYPAAGYRPDLSHPYRLAENGRVKQRLAELARPVARKTQVTLETLVNDLAADRELARRLEQPSAAIAATVAVAKLLGLMIDRRESGKPGAFSTVDDVLAQAKEELGAEAAATLRAVLDRSVSE